MPETMFEQVEYVIKSATDNTKLSLDYLKHLTTLATGTLVLLTTFQGRLTGAAIRWTIPVAMILLLFCVMYTLVLWVQTLNSLSDATVLLVNIKKRGQKKRGQKKAEKKAGTGYPFT